MGRVSASVRATDDRLLEAAIDQFGRYGLDGASTRSIARAAGTTMSAITYHYGGKEGLYVAAARRIAAQMEARMAPAVAEAQTRSTESDDPVAARDAVLAIVDRLAEVMLHPQSALFARFVLREQMEPTPAFDVLYGAIMERLIDHLSSLIVRISGGRCDPAQARLRTMAIVGQALVFRVARATLLRMTGWEEVDAAGAEAIRAIIRSHTIAILTHVHSEGGPTS